MKADVVLVVKVDVSQASAVIERMQQVLADEFGVPAPESAAAQVDLPTEGSRWRNKDDSSATWRVTSSRMSRVHAEPVIGSGPIGRWTGTADQFRNEFFPVPTHAAGGLGPRFGSRWTHQSDGGEWKVTGTIPTDNPFTVRLKRIDAPGDWAGSVAKHNSDFTEVTR